MMGSRVYKCIGATSSTLVSSNTSMLLYAIPIETLSSFVFFVFCFFLPVSSALMQRFGAIPSNIIHRSQHSIIISNQARSRLEGKVLTQSMNTSFKTESYINNNSNSNNFSSGSSSSGSSSSSSGVISKDIWIIRHGQAVHNPRAEYARDVLQCSHDEFLSIMEEDDCFDAPLTDLGVQQAQQIYYQYGKLHWGMTSSSPTTSIVNGEDNNESSLSLSSSSSIMSPQRYNIELVVSSPLSRALQTAELALGDTNHPNNNNNNQQTIATTTPITNRICYEGFREINGWLQNGKRHTKLELEEKFPYWDFSLLSSNEDNQWTPTLETTESCMERGYHGLLWIMKERSEQSIILVAHGALLKYTLTDHPNVILRDGRKHENNMETDMGQSQQPRCVRKRYHNCELRRYRMELLSPKQCEDRFAAATADDGDEDSRSNVVTNINGNVQQDRDIIILTEVDL